MRLARSVLVCALAAGALAISVPASAHDSLSSSDPADGSTVSGITEVRLEFAEAVLDIGTVVTVMDASEQDHASGAPTYPEPTTLSTPMENLAPGAYAIHWRVVSADGHPIEGVIDFTVATATSASPSPTLEPQPAVLASATPSATVGTDVVTGALILAGGAGLVALLVALVVRRRWR